MVKEAPLPEADGSRTRHTVWSDVMVYQRPFISKVVAPTQANVRMAKSDVRILVFSIVISFKIVLINLLEGL
jgi:hypothetical protein